MAGVKGRSGRKPLPLAAHILAGTFRPDRHGSRAAALLSMANARDVAPIDAQAPSTLTAGLGERGSAFVLAIWREYEDWPPHKLVLLHELGTVVDALARYEAIIGTQAPGVVTDTGVTVARLQAQAQRTYALLLGKLDLKD